MKKMKKPMNELEKLRRKPIGKLRTMAEHEGLKVAIRWNRRTMARKILEKRKIKELDKELEKPVEPQGPQRKPEFEALAGEGPPSDVVESEPGPPEAEEMLDEGPEPGPQHGRTMGMTDEKARVGRLMKNQVPDPVYLFALDKLFSGWQLFAKDVPGIKLTKDEAKVIGIPATNLMSYYFPNFKPTPVLEMWVGLYMGLELVIGSRLELIRESRSESGPKKHIEKTVVEIMDRLRSMPPEQRSRFADMLGIKVEAE